jgi:hypothetical protein
MPEPRWGKPQENFGKRLGSPEPAEDEMAAAPEGVVFVDENGVTLNPVIVLDNLKRHIFHLQHHVAQLTTANDMLRESSAKLCQTMKDVKRGAKFAIAGMGIIGIVLGAMWMRWLG